jgi:hypothetical protein
MSESFRDEQWQSSRRQLRRRETGGEQPEADLRPNKEQGRLVPSPAAKSIPVSNTNFFISASASGKAANALRNEDRASESRFLDKRSLQRLRIFCCPPLDSDLPQSSWRELSLLFVWDFELLWTLVTLVPHYNRIHHFKEIVSYFEFNITTGI